MSPLLKAIVFKTTRLKETRTFFETVLGLKISECSRTHFVIHDGKIRVLFVVSDMDPGPELYLSNHCPIQLMIFEDPNQMKIILVHE